MHTDVIILILAGCSALGVIVHRYVRSQRGRADVRAGKAHTMSRTDRVPADLITLILDAASKQQWLVVIEAGECLVGAHEDHVTDDVRIALSSAYFDQQRFTDSLRVYEEILKHASDDPEHYANIAQIRIKCGELEQAISDLMRAVELDVSNASYRNELANVQQLRKRR